MIWNLYRLEFPNGKSYIGIAIDTAKRFRSHKNASERGDGYAVHKAIKKFGWNEIKKSVLCIGKESYIKEMETKAIASFNSRPPNGYNLTSGGDGTSGVEFKEERREEIRLRMLGNSHTKGKKYSEEENAARRGKWKRTDEFKQAMRELMTGREFTEETLAKMKASAKNRPPVKDETRAKVSLSLLGNSRKKGVPISEEQKAGHKKFFERVRQFAKDSSYEGSLRNVTKVMMEEFYEKQRLTQIVLKTSK